MKLNKVHFISFLLTLLSIGVLPYSAEGENISVSHVLSVNDDVIIHTVAKGETVYSIAAKYNVSVQDIHKLNPGSEKGIRDGRTLRIPQVKKISGYSNHLIEAKETLYSVARMYKVSEDDVKKANPGLSENNFNIGKTIKIPVYGNTPFVLTTYNHGNVTASEPTYKVKKGDTLYSIGRAHNVSVEALLAANPTLKERGLKEGTDIIIPTAAVVTEPQITPTYRNTDDMSSPTSFASRGETVRVGVLLPFTDSKGSVQKEKLAEYYEGFLLAVKTLKEKGLNAEIYTFDTGAEKNTDRLKSLLGTNEIKNLHLVVGGVSKGQIDMLSRFSKETGVKYVVPFGSSKDISSNSNIFQMTTLPSALYAEVTTAFVERFGKENIIFVSEKGSDNNKNDFVAELKKVLTSSGITFKTVTGPENLLSAVKSQLSSQKNIIVPTSSSEVSLRRISGTLTSLLSSNTISLFGYPEWQAYPGLQPSLHKFDSYIYSTFFLDENQKQVRDFAEQYRNWYNKPLINSYPKWAYLGYDMGLFFLTALKDQGSNFEAGLNRIHVQSLQSAIYFAPARNDNGGYINNGIYFVHYKVDSNIEKLEISDRW